MGVILVHDTGTVTAVPTDGGGCKIRGIYFILSFYALEEIMITI